MRDYCSIADQGCLSPAGYRTFSGAAPNLEPGEVSECEECGEPVCASCSTEGVCANCVEHHEKIASAPSS